ncbi:hypothetical protein [Synechocystis sp. CACIAM 05]|nr:hypothetical protein [Synechocystis sp. CACIAM 05]
MAAFFLAFISPLEAAMHCSIWDEFKLSVINCLPGAIAVVGAVVLLRF